MITVNAFLAPLDIVVMKVTVLYAHMECTVEADKNIAPHVPLEQPQHSWVQPVSTIVCHAQILKMSHSGERLDGSSTSGIENSCRISKCSAGYHLVETIGEENLFDISKVVNSAKLTHTENSITSTGNPAYLGSKLNVLCPQCKADKYYLLSHDDSNHFSTFMIKGGAERYFWYADNVLHMNDIILGAIWGFYPGTFNNISIREYSSECVQCPENTYENNGKCVACPDGLYSYPGSDEYGDCSHILHIGTEQLYLRGNKQTTPSLHVQIGDQIFYGNMTQQNTPMSKHTEKHLRTNYDGTIWSIYDDSAITQ